MDIVQYKLLTGHDLKDARDNWKGLCPIHSEASPSFFIHKETYICHCFGCGIKGFLDVVLARGLEIPASEVRSRLKIPATSRYVRDDDHIVVPLFDRAWLAGFPTITSHPFLLSRGLRQKVIEAHEARWDKYTARIVFPLRSLGTEVVGVAGRCVVDHPKKWYFYWNAKKGEVLYASKAFIAREQIANTLTRSHPLIVVEGIFDVMKLNQAGYWNVVSLLGSCPSSKQVQLLKHSTEEIILFLDNDVAGRAGQETLRRILNQDTKLSYVIYPEGTNDPCELDDIDIDKAIIGRQTYVQYNASK